MSSRREGRLELWNDERGFGFIRADDGDRLFVHISAIGRIATRPMTGDAVSFATGTGRDGKPAALAVTIKGANPVDRSVERRGAPPQEAELRDYLRIGGACVIVVLVFAALIFDRAPLWLLGVYLGLGLVSALAYLDDKRSAKTGHWRVSELRLHLVDLAGGIAGGLVAQLLLRHKTAKSSFATITTAIWLLHVALLVAVLFGAVRLD